jgi:AAA+ superfamily predicted ATPase
MTDPAIDSLRAALQVAPNDAALRQMLAERLADRGRVDEAIEEYRTAIRSKPDDLHLQVALGALFITAGRHSAAELLLDEALRGDPVNAQAHLLRSRALAAQDRFSEAAVAYAQAIRIDPLLADEAFSVRLGFAAGAATTPDATGAPRSRGPGQAATEPTPVTSPSKALDDVHHHDAKAVPASKPNGHAAGSRRVLDGPGDSDTEDDIENEEAADLSPEERALLERPRISFADVGGMNDLKEEIRLKILYPRVHPELYKAYGKKAGGGILLYGPPGCGKTHLARATAGELGAVFIVVGIADVLDMWIGSSERNLQRIFAMARTHTPAVLFFDEVDALAASRSDFKGSAGRHVINQFLAELDGAESSNEGVLVIGATNAPWHMDSAFRRPGRFDQIVFVPPPDVGARAAILRVLLRDRPAGDVDVSRVAAAAEGYSGADLLGMVDRAIETKLAAAIREGVPRPLGTDDLIRAQKSAPPSTREWFATVRNYVLYANEGGLYDPVRPYLKGR